MHFPMLTRFRSAFVRRAQQMRAKLDLPVVHIQLRIHFEPNLIPSSAPTKPASARPSCICTVCLYSSPLTARALYYNHSVVASLRFVVVVGDADAAVNAPRPIRIAPEPPTHESANVHRKHPGAGHVAHELLRMLANGRRGEATDGGWAPQLRHRTLCMRRACGKRRRTLPHVAENFVCIACVCFRAFGRLRARTRARECFRMTSYEDGCKKKLVTYYE